MSYRVPFSHFATSGMWRIGFVSIVFIISSALSGCGVAQTGLELIRQASPGDIRVDITSDHDPASIRENYKTVAIIVRTAGGDSTGNAMSFWSGSSGGFGADIFSRRMVSFLSRLNIRCLESGDLEGIATEEQKRSISDRVMLDLAKKAKADALLFAVLQQGTAQKFGLLGVGASSETGIVSVSFKLVEVNRKKTIAIISADYPEPRTATQVVDGLQAALKDVFART